jgi:hypothetical protein
VTEPTYTPRSRTPCPRCQQQDVMLGTWTERFVYLRCQACSHIWSIPERRAAKREQVPLHGNAGGTPLNGTG